MATVDLGKIALLSEERMTLQLHTHLKMSFSLQTIVKLLALWKLLQRLQNWPSTNGTINSTHWAIFAKGASIASNYQSSAWQSGTVSKKGAVVQFTDSGTLSAYLAVADSTTTVNGRNDKF